MQAPIIPAISDKEPLSQSEEKTFRKAIELVADASYEGAKKILGARRSEAGGWCLSLGMAASGIDHIGASYELAKHSAPIVESQHTHKHATEKEPTTDTSHPTFRQWCDTTQKLCVSYRCRAKFTRGQVKSFLEEIRKGLACCEQVPYGKSGKTRKEIRELLEKAELRTNSILQLNELRIEQHNEDEQEIEQQSVAVEAEVRRNMARLGKNTKIVQD